MFENLFKLNESNFQPNYLSGKFPEGSKEMRGVWWKSEVSVKNRKAETFRLNQKEFNVGIWRWDGEPKEDKYGAFHGFGQAKFLDGGSVLGSSQFFYIAQLPQKTTLNLKSGHTWFIK